MAEIEKKAPANRQTILFSATIPSWVKGVVSRFMDREYKTIDLCKDLSNKTSKTIKHLAIQCPYHNRMSTLADILLIYGFGQTIVFTQTKADANQLLLSEKLSGKAIEVMHGDIPQNQREVTLRRFKDHKFNVLVATDVASRGLDIPTVDLVVQVEPPKDAETYIHRSGRTARAGKQGTCITFYTMKQVQQLMFLEQKTGITFAKIGIPQPEQVIRAQARDITKNLDEVNKDVVDIFEETAQDLVEKYGDAKSALKYALAFMSGHKTALTARSLLSGQEGSITFEIRMNQPFQAISLVWSVLRKFWPQELLDDIRGMRGFKD
jgi:ATP-dependent RNA helicase DDX21